MWAFNRALKKTKSLTKNVTYSWKLENEQAEVMSNIADNGVRTWIIEMKTWRWKSHIVMSIINHFQEPTIVVCHTLSSVYDMQEKFREYLGIEPWIYGGNKKEISEITITTHRSFTLKKDELRWKFWIVIIDECDYNLTEEMVDTIINCDSDWVFWLSWTPQRKELDIIDMEFIFGKHIKVSWQDNNWYNIIPDVLRVEYYTDKTYSFGTQWHLLKEALLADQDRTNQQVSWILGQMREWKIKYWLLLVERKEDECDKYFNLLAPHIKCCIINWDTKQEDDKRNIEEIAANWKWIIIWTVGKIWRWKDIPMIDWVFLFFPSRFENNTIQAAGRWLRKFTGKSKCTLVDRCDMPLLKAQSYERCRTYKKEYTESVTITTTKILPVSDDNELFKI